ncbi:MAG: cupin domain-containing protein [Actinobacteria bacterium]|nr:cupin domain-containing protein [Actinomycetota bacterium]
MNSEVCPWGSYEVLQESAIHKVKSIIVQPGKRLSYQRHEKRAEHWFIVSGEAEVTIDGQIRKVTVGNSVDIEIGVPHRIANVGTSGLLFIEVQTGSYFGEDDIVRIEDDFGRE